MRRFLECLLIGLAAATIFNALGYGKIALYAVLSMIAGIISTYATLAAAPDSPVGLKIVKDAAAALQSAATVVALIIGAWWVLKRRRTYPRAKFTHSVSHVKLDEERILLHVAITVENVGDVLLPLVPSVVCAQQLTPPPAEHASRLAGGQPLLPEGAQEVDWPIVSRCDQDWRGNEFEPGESGAFHFDLVVPAETETALIYSYFRNLAKTDKEIGWNTSTFYTIEDPKLSEAQGPRSAKWLHRNQVVAVLAGRLRPAVVPIERASAKVHRKLHRKRQVEGPLPEEAAVAIKPKTQAPPKVPLPRPKDPSKK